jgi:hypothetical protein
MVQKCQQRLSAPQKKQTEKGLPETTKAGKPALTVRVHSRLPIVTEQNGCC